MVFSGLRSEAGAKRMHHEEEDVNSLVRVRAQVMTRDDSSGGWVPLDRGGLSTVSVRRYKSRVPRSSRSSDSEITPVVLEYRILGKRISDQTVILSCAIKKDFEYNKVMPTFHHWRNGSEKYGLAFTTAADGRAFDKSVRIAIDELVEGWNDFSIFQQDIMPRANPTNHVAEMRSYYAYHAPEHGLCETSPLKQVDDDDEVFMALSLPLEGSSEQPKRRDRSAFTPVPEGISPVGVSSTTLLSSPEFSAPATPTIQETSLCEIEFANPPNEDVDPEKNYHNLWESGRPWEPDTKRSEIYSYVQFSKEAMIETNHDYSYPVLSESESMRRNSIKKSAAPTPPPPRLPLPTKKSHKNRKIQDLKSPSRLRCKNCLEYYREEDNRHGACEHGPDPVRAAIDTVSCVGCADCIMYHCYSDNESEYGVNPCLCQTATKYPRRLDSSNRCRLVVLTLLSLFVPCLWCYLPLRACHKCGVYCGVCGPKHVSS